MKRLLGFLVLAGIGYLTYHAVETEEDAGRVLHKAMEMWRQTGDEAGEIALRVVAERYPFSTKSVEARRGLYEMRLPEFRQPEPDGGIALYQDRVLGDTVTVDGDPFVGLLGIAGAAVLLHLWGLFGRRSRTRFRSFLLLVVTLVLAAGTQTKVGLKTVAGMEVDVGQAVYSHLPWALAGSLLLGAVLAILPRGKPREDAEPQSRRQRSSRST